MTYHHLSNGYHYREKYRRQQLSISVSVNIQDIVNQRHTNDKFNIFNFLQANSTFNKSNKRESKHFELISFLLIFVSN